jgi:putative ABC transport system permease protein
MVSEAPAGSTRRSGLRARTALRFLLRSLGLRATGFALALGAVTVGASVAATALNLRADLTPKMNRELRSYGPNLLVTPPLARQGEAGGGGATLDETWVRSLERAAPPGTTVTVSPILLAAGRVGHEAAVIVGADLAALRVLGAAWRLDGAYPPTADLGSCLIGATLARRIGARPGDVLSIGVARADERPFRVAAVVATGEAEDEQALLPLAAVQAATGQAGRVSLAALAVEAGPDQVQELAAAIAAAAPAPVEARPLLQVSRAQGALLAKLQQMMVLLTGVILVLAGMCVMTTLMAMVVEREPEIGLMRSLGASDGEVLRMLLGEATLLGLAGGALGLLLGWIDSHWIGRQVFGAEVAARVEIAPVVLALTIGLCWAAVVAPLRRALRVQPATALRG